MKKPPKGSPLTGSSTPPLAAGMQPIPIPLITTWPLPASWPVDSSWHLRGQTTVASPRVSGGIKCKAYPVSQRQTTVKVDLKVQMADCAQDANRKWRPWHSKARTHHLQCWEVIKSVLAPGTTEYVPANSFAD